MRGLCHGLSSFLLPAHADRTRLAVRHTPVGVAERLCRRMPDNPGPPPPRPQRHREHTPFAGLTTKPPCDACEHTTAPRPLAPSAPPPCIVPTRGRRRQVDTSMHFCPNPACAYRGWVGWGNLRANGHPSGGPWRQLLCVVCRGYFLETFGTLLHGKRRLSDSIRVIFYARR
jgi:hypothetical protein